MAYESDDIWIGKSPVRQKAVALIESLLYGGAVSANEGSTPGVTKMARSNGDRGEAALYTKVTGITHQRLLDSWASSPPGQPGLTGCNAFTGWYGLMMGLKVNCYKFELQVEAGKLGAWVEYRPGMAIRPKYGDIVKAQGEYVDERGQKKHPNHLCVSQYFIGETWWCTEAGQGGRGQGCDIFKLYHERNDFFIRPIKGWVDIEKC